MIVAPRSTHSLSVVRLESGLVRPAGTSARPKRTTDNNVHSKEESVPKK